MELASRALTKSPEPMKDALMVQPYTTQPELDAAYESGVATFRILRSAFPSFEPRNGYKVRDIALAPAELLVVNVSRERTLIPE